jgi:putative spermidine/putrescine transport system permease protein
MKTAYFPAHYRLADKLGWLALRAFCVGVLLFLLLPIIVIVPLSFSSGSFLSYPLPGWSLQWYEELFASAEWARAARNSCRAAATLLATPWARSRPWGWRARALSARGSSSVAAVV